MLENLVADLMHDIFILVGYYMMTPCKFFPSYIFANQVVFGNY